jgi:hypothetical protein
VSIEDVLKIVSVVLIPSIGAVVWLLSQVYGLRGDLKGLQSELDAQGHQLQELERSVDKLAKSVTDLTILLARSGIDNEHRRPHNG